LLEHYIHEVKKISKQLADPTIKAESLKEIQKIAEKLLKDSKKYEDATTIADNWIKTN